jgi:hypothetical protein
MSLNKHHNFGFVCSSTDPNLPALLSKYFIEKVLANGLEAVCSVFEYDQCDSNECIKTVVGMYESSPYPFFIPRLYKTNEDNYYLKIVESSTIRAHFYFITENLFFYDCVCVHVSDIKNYTQVVSTDIIVPIHEANISLFTKTISDYLVTSSMFNGPLAILLQTQNNRTTVIGYPIKFSKKNDYNRSDHIQACLKLIDTIKLTCVTIEFSDKFIIVNCFDQDLEYHRPFAIKNVNDFKITFKNFMCDLENDTGYEKLQGFIEQNFPYPTEADNAELREYLINHFASNNSIQFQQ